MKETNDIYEAIKIMDQKIARLLVPFSLLFPEFTYTVHIKGERYMVQFFYKGELFYTSEATIKSDLLNKDFNDFKEDLANG